MSEPVRDPVEQAVWDSLIAVMSTLPAALEVSLRDSGMTHYEYRVLSALSAEPDSRLLLSELAKRTYASPSRLSHVMTKLERLGWVKRVPSEFSRGTFAVLTWTGAEVCAEATPGYIATGRALLRDGWHEQCPAEFLDRVLVRAFEIGAAHA